MIAVAVAYVLCLLPFYLFIIIEEVTLETNQVTEAIYQHLLILTFVNCCINPFIYAIKYDTFKAGCRRMCAVKSKTPSGIQNTGHSTLINL